MSESEEEINKQLIYWLNLLVNECFSDTPVIIIGSHKDTAKNTQRKLDQLTKVSVKYPSLKVMVQYLMPLHHLQISLFQIPNTNAKY